MTDEYAKSLLSELVKISENMATKADLWRLEQAMGDATEAMSAMMKPPDSSSDKETHEAWMEVKDAEIARLSDRVDTISGRLLDRIEALEISRKRHEQMISIAQTDQADMLHQQKAQWEHIEAIEKLLRSAETGETRTRPDTGASRMHYGHAPYEALCREVVGENTTEKLHLITCPECALLLVSVSSVVDDGGSGNPPVAPSPDSSGTEPSKEEIEREVIQKLFDSRGPHEK